MSSEYSLVYHAKIPGRAEARVPLLPTAVDENAADPTVLRGDWDRV